MRARGRDRERGASLVEFAFVVPLLALFLFGIVQFGLAYDNKQSLNSAAREGGRFASLSTSPVTGTAAAPGIVERAESSFLGAGGGTVDVRVEQPLGTPRSGSYKPCEAPTGNEIVAVIVELDHPVDIPFWGRRIVQMEAKAEFRCES